MQTKATRQNGVYDFIAIGVGPFNLSLAAMTSKLNDVNALFLDNNEAFNWHPGMMLQEVTLQTPFMSDLVTLADPTHELSFLNYLKQSGKIYSFYIRENFFILRQEYNQYCQWAANQLPNVVFNRHVRTIEYDEFKKIYYLQCTDPKTQATHSYYTKRLVLGVGKQAYVPDACQPIADQAIHSSRYLDNKEQLQASSAITVVGSGQSAAEIYYDLLQEIDNHGYELNWLTSAPRFYPLEYSKLTLEMTSPEYVDYFYQLPQGTKAHLNANHKNLYKGINSELINAIYDLLYSKSINHTIKSRLMTNCKLTSAQPLDRQNEVALTWYHKELEQEFVTQSQSVILATGYRDFVPECVQAISHRINWLDGYRYQVTRDYQIGKQAGEIFVQNAEHHSHGFVTPDLGMACYRNAHILNAITGRQCFAIEKQIAFQDFTIPESSLSINRELAS